MFYTIFVLFFILMMLFITIIIIDPKEIKDPLNIIVLVCSGAVCALMYYSKPISGDDKFEYEYFSQKTKILYKHEEHLKSSYKYILTVKYPNGCILDKDVSYYEYQNKNVGDNIYIFYEDEYEFRKIKSKKCTLG